MIGTKEEQLTEIMFLVHVRKDELVLAVALLADVQDLKLDHAVVDLAKFEFVYLSLVVCE